MISSSSSEADLNSVLFRVAVPCAPVQQLDILDCSRECSAPITTTLLALSPMFLLWSVIYILDWKKPLRYYNSLLFITELLQKCVRCCVVLYAYILSVTVSLVMRYGWEHQIQHLKGCFKSITQKGSFLLLWCFQLDVYGWCAFGLLGC